MGILPAFQFTGLQTSRTSMFCLIYIISLIIIAYYNVFLTDKCLFFQIIIILPYLIYVFSFNFRAKIDRLFLTD